MLPVGFLVFLFLLSFEGGGERALFNDILSAVVSENNEWFFMNKIFLFGLSVIDLLG